MQRRSLVSLLSCRVLRRPKLGIYPTQCASLLDGAGVLKQLLDRAKVYLPCLPIADGSVNDDDAAVLQQPVEEDLRSRQFGLKVVVVVRKEFGQKFKI